MCLYAQFLARSFNTANAIKSYLNVIKIVHKTIYEPVAGFEGCHLKLPLKGTAHTLNTLPTQAQPVTVEMLLDIKKNLNLWKSEDFLDSLIDSFFL